MAGMWRELRKTLETSMSVANSQSRHGRSKLQHKRARNGAVAAQDVRLDYYSDIQIDRYLSR